MLSLLLDEHLSPEIAAQILRKRADISIASLHHWQGGQFMGQSDESILHEAVKMGATLVTYDQRTILSVIALWGNAGITHSGVIFIDNRTIAPSNFGELTRSLIALWDRASQNDWTKAVTYLTRER